MLFHKKNPEYTLMELKRLHEKNTGFPQLLNLKIGATNCDELIEVLDQIKNSPNVPNEIKIKFEKYCIGDHHNHHIRRKAGLTTSLVLLSPLMLACVAISIVGGMAPSGKGLEVWEPLINLAVDENKDAKSKAIEQIEELFKAVKDFSITFTLNLNHLKLKSGTIERLAAELPNNVTLYDGKNYYKAITSNSNKL